MSDFDGVRFNGDERALHGDIRLDGTDIDLVVGGALVGFDEEHDVGGSPIMRLTLLDPDCTIERSGLLDLDADDDDKLGREVELIVDGVAYWLRQVQRAVGDDTVMLVFEDRTVCLLRDRDGVMKVSARTLDVRGFMRRLCAAVGAPELIVNDPGGREEAARDDADLGTVLRQNAAQADRDRKRKPGIATEAPITVKGGPASPEQRRNINIALTEALRHGPSALALITMVAAITQESNWMNRQGDGADSISWGLVQNIPGRSAGVNGTFTREQALDIPYTIRSVLLPPGPTSAGGLIKVANARPNLDAGTLADICINGVGVGDPGYVGKVNGYVAEAKRIIAAFTGGDIALSSGASFSVVTRTESALTVERGESYWDAGRRTAEAYNARFFVVANQPYFLFDEALMKSRPLLTLANPMHPDADPRRAQGVEGIGWEWAPRKQLRTTDVRLNVTVRHAPVGSVVLLDETCGPAGSTREHPNRGRWLIGRYQRSRFDATADVMLIKGRKPKVPVTVDTQTVTVGGAGRDGAVRVGKGGTTSPFGGQRRYPITGPYGTQRPGHVHSGLDVGVPCGTPCIAPFDGEITYVSTSGFGTAGGMVHLRASAAVPGTSIRAGDKIGWGHVRSAAVKVGQKVAAGTPVATSGGSPCHVHFVLIRSGGGGNGIDGNADPTADLRALGGLS